MDEKRSLLVFKVGEDARKGRRVEQIGEGRGRCRKGMEGCSP